MIFILYKVNVPPALSATTLIKAISAQQGGPGVNLEYFKKAFSYRAFGDSEIREQLVQATSQSAGAQGVDQKIKSDFFDYTRTQILLQLERTPNDARYFLFAGSFFASFGDLDNAIKALTKAHELSPKKQTISFSLGSAYLGKQDFKNAVAITREAFELDKSFDDARRLYALALVYDKQIKTADEILKPLNPETVLGNLQLIIAYYASGYYDRALEGINFLIKKRLYRIFSIQNYFISTAFPRVVLSLFDKRYFNGRTYLILTFKFLLRKVNLIR